MSKILIDTSIIIDYLRQKDKSKTLLYNLSREYELYASIVTHTESYAGKSIWERKEAMDLLEKLLSSIKILPLNESISKQAGQLSVTKHNVQIIDAVIAATALHHTMQLATLNIKDFKKIEGIKFAKV